jgi:putative SOS response-associated peptidase YedK
VLKEMRWGLIPSWAKDEKIGNKLTNARAETMTEKPSFKKPFQTRAC